MRTYRREHDLASDRGLFRSRSGRFSAALPFLDALRPLNSEQLPARHEQIGQRTGQEQAIGIFRDAAVAHLVESEDALHDANRVLDLGTNGGNQSYIASSPAFGCLQALSFTDVANHNV